MRLSHGQIKLSSSAPHFQPQLQPQPIQDLLYSQVSQSMALPSDVSHCSSREFGCSLSPAWSHHQTPRPPFTASFHHFTGAFKESFPVISCHLSQHLRGSIGAGRFKGAHHLPGTKSPEGKGSRCRCCRKKMPEVGRRQWCSIPSLA